MWLLGALIFLAPLLLLPLAGKSVTFQTWTPLGQQQGAVQGVAFRSERGLTTIYLWNTSSLLRSVDEGHSWLPVGAGLPHDASQRLLLTQLVAGGQRRVYALAGEQGRRSLYRSNDAGETFKLLFSPQQFNPAYLAVKPGPENDILAIGGGRHVRLSQDGGNTWQEIRTPAPLTALHLADALYLAGPAWLWIIPDPVRPPQALAIPHRETPQTILASTRGPQVLFILTQEGHVWRWSPSQDWVPLRPAQGRTITALTQDPIIWQHVFLGDSQGTVWRTQDTGAHWHTLDGPVRGPIQRLLLDPSRRDRLYALAGRTLWWHSVQPLAPTPTATACSLIHI